MSTVYALNKTDSTITVSSWKVFYINSTNAELVNVYDSNNNSYDCFKYLLNNVSWFYVLDGIHNIWVDDLSSIGYTEISPVVLPTVTTHYWEHNNGWLESVNGAESVSAGGSSSSLRYGYAEGGQTVYVTPDYELNRSYGIIQWQQTAGTTAGRTEFEIAELGGKICAKNISSATKTFLQARVAVCSSNQATVVTVYNFSNVAYNAFKYAVNNTDYYYVLDGIQEDWTDNLSSIGYNLVICPTISVTGDFGDSNWLYANVSGSNVTITSGDYKLVGTGGSSSPREVAYDPTKSYAVIRWGSFNSEQGSGHIEFSIRNENNIIYAENVTSGSLYLYAMHVAVCSDSTANVVTVYDSTFNTFNAFRITIDGKNYYYVLDETQTNWTDNLSNIGYSITLPQPSIGDIVIFGRYRQDSTTVLRPIEWRVLDVDTINHNALIISRYALDSKPFTNSYSPRWQSSTYRDWLNGSFWTTSFNTNEQLAVVLSVLDTDGVATQDHIFALTVSDANNYFSNDNDRLCVGTAYAISQGVYHTETDNYVPWWLRSVATDLPNDKMSFVESDGTVHPEGYYDTDTHFGVRPALWVHYGEPSIGDTILFGNYPQSNTSTSEQIEWEILDKDTLNNKCLVISKYILDACVYVNSGYSQTDWEQSNARNWLNSTFYNNAFSNAEKTKILTSTIITPDNSTYGTSGGNSTQDKIFCLSMQEASSYFEDDNARKTYATVNAISHGVWTSSGYGVWLARTPGQTNANVVNVSHQGLVFVQGDAVTSDWVGIRPAFWMSYV